METKREYHLIIIMNPELALEQAKEEVESILKEFKAEIKKSEVLGRKDLQYERKKYTSGLYLEYQILLEKDKAQELQRLLNIKNNVLQYFLKNLAKK
jgi:ribosomal protein S6